MLTFNALLRDYIVKNAFYSIEEFLSADHNNVDIWPFIFNVYYYEGHLESKERFAIKNIYW